MRRLAIVAIATLALAGCAAITPPPDTQVVIAKGDYGFEVLYNGAAQLYYAAPADKQAQALPLMKKLLTCDHAGNHCTGYVQLARDAVAALNAASLASEVAQITSTVAEVQSLLKGS